MQNYIPLYNIVYVEKMLLSLKSIFILELVTKDSKTVELEIL